MLAASVFICFDVDLMAANVWIGGRTQIGRRFELGHVSRVNSGSDVGGLQSALVWLGFAQKLLFAFFYSNFQWTRPSTVNMERYFNEKPCQYYYSCILLSNFNCHCLDSKDENSNFWQQVLSVLYLILSTPFDNFR